jgi:hypothetical protein
MSQILRARTAGVTYIAASIGFLVVFGWLAANFGYPDVLDQPAAEVLPRLLQLGVAGRAVWLAYAILPLLLIPAAIGAGRGKWRRSDRVIRAAVALQSAAAIAMTIGLARWSTLQWHLAEQWNNAGETQRHALADTFDTLNRILGNTVGEFVGELALFGSLLAFAPALWRRGDVTSRVVAVLAGITGAAGWMGMFRNVAPAVQPATDLTNLLLPLFLIAFGVVLWRDRD